MDIFAKENNLTIESVTLTKLEGSNIFSPGVIKRIFETDDKSINLITDNMLKDNFIIYSKETKLPKIKKQDQNFDNFKLKAKLRLANNIYNVYDLSLNRKYNVEINDKTLNRIKKFLLMKINVSFQNFKKNHLKKKNQILFVRKKCLNYKKG